MMRVCFTCNCNLPMNQRLSDALCMNSFPNRLRSSRQANAGALGALLTSPKECFGWVCRCTEVGIYLGEERCLNFGKEGLKLWGKLLL